jgi:hypothetical protein
MGKYAKAIAGGIAAALGSLLLVLTGNETIADVTTVEWIAVGVNVLGSYGIVYAAPANTPGPLSD